MNNQQTQGYFKALSILYTALFAGQIIFALLALTLVYTGSFTATQPALENIFFILVPLLIIAGRVGGTAIFKKKIAEALNTSSVTEKLNIYRSAFITRCALIEGGVLLAIITYLLTGRIELLAFAAGGLLLFAMLKPNKEKIANELNISSSDID
jgi:prolipoprotein diacylglyceryltransferase